MVLWLMPVWRRRGLGRLTCLKSGLGSPPFPRDGKHQTELNETLLTSGSLWAFLEDPSSRPWWKAGRRLRTFSCGKRVTLMHGGRGKAPYGAQFWPA